MIYLHDLSFPHYIMRKTALPRREKPFPQGSTASRKGEMAVILFPAVISKNGTLEIASKKENP